MYQDIMQRNWGSVGANELTAPIDTTPTIRSSSVIYLDIAGCLTLSDSETRASNFNSAKALMMRRLWMVLALEKSSLLIASCSFGERLYRWLIIDSDRDYASYNTGHIFNADGVLIMP